MSERVLTDAYKIKKLMREAEAVTDEASLLCAQLKQAMISSRQNPDIPVATGQSALLRLNQAEQQIHSASSNLFRVHNELSGMARIYALDDTNIPTEEPLAADRAAIYGEQTPAGAEA